MPLYAGIKASVVPLGDDGHPMQEYMFQGGHRGGRNKPVERYIESTIDQRLAVVVDVTAEFDFCALPDIRIDCCIDGTVRYTRYVNKELALREYQRDRAAFQRQFSHSNRLVHGYWKMCNFAFGVLVKSMRSPRCYCKVMTNEV